MKGPMSTVLCKFSLTLCPKFRNARLLQLCRSAHSYNYCSRLGSDREPVFKPKKAVILSRITRYEFENLRFKVESDEELRTKVNLIVP